METDREENARVAQLELGTGDGCTFVNARVPRGVLGQPTTPAVGCTCEHRIARGARRLSRHPLMPSWRRACLFKLQGREERENAPQVVMRDRTCQRAEEALNPSAQKKKSRSAFDLEYLFLEQHGHRSMIMALHLNWLASAFVTPVSQPHAERTELIIASP